MVDTFQLFHQEHQRKDFNVFKFNFERYLIVCNFREFKVNAMDEAELRKSIKRQKFEKSGLPLRASSAGTGTGTSDTEDDASTPSAENADRSLESALGGSMESISIQQDSSTFLQAALDGPSAFADRGSNSEYLFVGLGFVLLKI